MPVFQVIFGHKDQPKSEWQLLDNTYYTEARTASEIVRCCNIYYPEMKHMVKRVVGDEDFLTREAARTDYTPFEVQGETWHFAELIGDKISYFNSKANAADNKRTEIKLGRYLRAYTGLSDPEVAKICAKNGVQCEDLSLQWARTKEEIMHVYARGPHSCMHGQHCVQAYAGPDTAIAYIIRDDRITARTVVNIKTQKYLRAYGDSTRLEELLQKEGYIQSDNCLKGARLLKIPIPGNSDWYYWPYVDGNYNYGYEKGKYLIASDTRGGYGGEQGRIRITSAQCKYTVDDEDYYEDDDLYYEDDYY